MELSAESGILFTRVSLELLDLEGVEGFGFSSFDWESHKCLKVLLSAVHNPSEEPREKAV